MIEAERLIIPERYDAQAEFELWRYNGECTEHALIPAGVRGDKVPAMESLTKFCSFPLVLAMSIYASEANHGEPFCKT
jgi:hypothetical protein